MFEPVDRKAAIIAAEQLQMIENAFAIVRREFLLLARDDVPILLRPVDHRAEFGVIVRHLVHGSLSLSAASLRHSLLFATCGGHLLRRSEERRVGNECVSTCRT